MLNMNRVTLLGHAGRDPEVRTVKSGDKTATFSLATTDKWRRQDGGTGEATQWHRIVVFGAAVAAVEKLVRKGAALLVEGRITSHEYQDKKGESRRVTEIVVSGRKAASMCYRRAGTTAARKRAARRREPAILAGPSMRGRQPGSPLARRRTAPPGSGGSDERARGSRVRGAGASGAGARPRFRCLAGPGPGPAARRT